MKDWIKKRLDYFLLKQIDKGKLSEKELDQLFKELTLLELVPGINVLEPIIRNLCCVMCFEATSDVCVDLVLVGRKRNL